MNWIWFVVMTILCWGAYIPVIHEGQAAIGSKPAPRALWSFLFVGAAYCLMAVLGPLAVLAQRGELSPFPPLKGATLSILAGLVGAAGAFGVILAMINGGKPTTVPPLVFAGAPIVAVLLSMALHPPAKAPNVMFFVGIVMAAAGASIVLRFRP